MQPQDRLAIVMVGLPARGKSTLSNKIYNYLCDQQLNTKIFNFGSYRRIATKNSTVGKASASFFDPDNKEASRIREQCCIHALDDLISFYNKGGNVGILDATNTTLARRKIIRDFIAHETSELDYNVSILFVETICNNEEIIHNNIVCGKLNNADYCVVDAQKAISDFKERIKMYEKAYCEVQKYEGSYIKVIDFGSEIDHHQIDNNLSSQIFYLVLNSYLHSLTKTPQRPNWINHQLQMQQDQAAAKIYSDLYALWYGIQLRNINSIESMDTNHSMVVRLRSSG